MQQEDNLPSAPLIRKKLTKKQHCLALILAGLPLELGLVLFILSPHYVGAVFRATYGLATVAAILICAAVAYPLLLGSFAVSNSAEPQGQTARKVIGCSLAIGVVVFCILPAVYLLMLGPQLLTMIACCTFGRVP